MVATETQTPRSFSNIWRCSSKVAVSFSSITGARAPSCGRGWQGSSPCAPERASGRSLAAGSLQLDVGRDGRKRDPKELGNLPPRDAALNSVEHLQPEVLRVGVHGHSLATLQLLCKPL